MANLDIVARFQNQASQQIGAFKSSLSGLSEVGSNIKQSFSQAGAGIKQSFSQATGALNSFGLKLRQKQEDIAASTEGIRYLYQQAQALTVGLAAAGAVFKKTFDLAEEGAAIERTNEKLDALASTIGTTADAMLGGLRQATNGAVDDLTLMRGAVTFLNMGFVDTQDGANALMQKILLLKDPAESAQSAIENFSLMLANQSVARLDSFGLSSGRVKTRIDELIASGQAMNREQAFTMATMEEMDVALQRQGLSANDLGTAYDRLKVKVINVTTGFKQFLNEGLEPVAEAVAGDYGSKVEGLIDDQVALAASTDDLIALYRRVSDQLDMAGGAAAYVTGTHDDLSAGLDEVKTQIALSAGSAEEYVAIMRELGAVNDSTYASGSAAAAMFYEQATAANALAVETERLTAMSEYYTEVQAANASGTETFSGIMQAFGETYAETAVNVSMAIAQQQAAEEALQAEQEALRQSHVALIDEWESSQEPVAALVTAYGNMKTATGDLIQVDGEWVAGTEVAQQSIEEAHAAIQDSYRQTAFDAIVANQGITESTVALGVELGLLTEQEAALRLEYVNTTAAIQDLTGRADFLSLSVGQQAEAIRLLSDGYVDTADQAIALAGSVDGVTSALDAGAQRAATLRQNLDDIPEEVNVHFGFTADPIPAIPNVPGAEPVPFAGGGYTGDAPESQIAGVVHGREYVFDAASVRSIGLERLRGLHGAAGNGRVPDRLLAETRAAQTVSIGGLRGGGNDESRIQINGGLHLHGVQNPQSLIEQIRSLTP